MSTSICLPESERHRLKEASQKFDVSEPALVGLAVDIACENWGTDLSAPPPPPRHTCAFSATLNPTPSI